MAAVQLLNDLPFFEKKLDRSKVKNGLKNIRKNTNYIGRWQVLGTQPTILADSAHNKAGISNLVAFIEAQPSQNLHFVFGTVSDKDPTPILNMLPKKARYYFAKANVPRGMHAQKLLEAANKAGLYGKAYSSVKKALAAAKSRASEDDFILVAGSIFVVAEVV